MTESIHSVWVLVTAIVVGYALGSLPVAAGISRGRGVDIFTSGTRLAGASNVLRHVGPMAGLVVIIGDILKGILAVLAARVIGVEGTWVLLPAGAAILGHWNSIFTGFRGGDGLGPLGGITMALFPASGVIGVAVAMVVALGGQKMPYTSLLSVVCGLLTVAMLNYAQSFDMSVTFGLLGLGALVLAHASLGHRRRRRADGWQDIGDIDSISE